MAVTLSAVAVYSGYTINQMRGLRRLQTQTIDQNRTDSLARMYATIDPHSPGRWRGNGSVSNMPEFKEAFHCKADVPMVRQNACRVW